MSEVAQHMYKNSSYSRTYLTQHNNQFQRPHEAATDAQVLAERRERNLRLAQLGRPGARRQLHIPSLHPTPSKVAVPYTVEPAASAPSTNEDVMTIEAEEDYTRAPESSDDENENVAPTQITHVLPTPEPTQTSPKKRPLNKSNVNTTTAATRSSKRLKRDEKNEEAAATASTMAEQSKTLNVPPIPSQELPFISQSSQSRRKRKYGDKNKNSFLLPSSPRSPEKRTDAKDLDVPDFTPATPDSRASGNNAKIIMPTPSPQPAAQARGLDLPEGDDLHDRPDHSRKRSGSTSSLSSADSDASLDLDNKARARLKAEHDIPDEPEETLPANHIRCPTCKRPVSKPAIAFILQGRHLSQLTRPQQQKFCYDHRQRDARQEWKEAGYPEIDFERLPTSQRVQTHIRDLVPIIKRQRESYYLTKLDEAMTDAKGNQGKIRRYFDVTCIEQIKHGYYGPRGAKVLSRAIAEDAEVSKLLKKVTKSDKAFRVAGFGRFVDCVLLPELLLKLVQDDMKLEKGESGQEEARQLLEDSEQLGMLLCQDDDHVEEIEDEIED